MSDLVSAANTQSPFERELSPTCLACRHVKLVQICRSFFGVRERRRRIGNKSRQVDMSATDGGVDDGEVAAMECELKRRMWYYVISQRRTDSYRDGGRG